MERRPVIGIATQTLEAVPGKLPRTWIMGQSYVRTLIAEGGIPWLIPLVDDDLETLRAIYERLDGIFLIGGVDVDPECYGAPRTEACGPIDPARDRTELQFIRWAMEDRKPILGVCRGLQIVNVAGGGTLYQDLLRDSPHTTVKHDCFPPADGYERHTLVHEVAVERHTRLGRLLGTDQTPVNSMHHQGIRDLAPGLVPSAFAPDGLIEGVEGTDGQFLIAVQWHPEELIDSVGGMRHLFSGLVGAAIDHGAGAHPLA